MKELSIEEKARAYDEAIKYAHYLINERCKENTDGSFHRADLNKMFPELAESEDERIRKELISFFTERAKYTEDSTFNGLSSKEIIAWLEKQSEQKLIDKIQLGKKYKCIASPRYSTFVTGFTYKPEDKFLCSLMNFCSDCFEPIEDGGQKPTDKIEPKFHKGEWVILTAGELSTTLQIVNVDTNKKLYWFNDNSYLPIVDEECLHLWTIQDAKDGDVLVSKDGDEILIFRNLDTSTSFSSYYNIQRKGELGWSNECFIPATKEQRDTLMKAMADAGYTFDFEKKELKKIEQKPVWSEEDEDAIGMAIIALEDMYDTDAPNNTYAGYTMPFNKAALRLRAIKERVQPQPKQEWSEEDEEEFQIAIDTLAEAGQNDSAHWLQFLKDRYTWKPSEEQMEALDDFIYAKYPNTEKHGAAVKSLYQDLKKLREE